MQFEKPKFFKEKPLEEEVEKRFEKEKIPWSAKIILQRHGEFYQATEDQPEFKEWQKKGILGMLTEKGIKETREFTKRKLEEILESKKAVDILFLYSPTEWYDYYDPEKGWQKGFGGSRGKHTMKVILDTLADELKKRNLKKDKIRILGIGPQDKLRELNIFYIVSAEDPQAYFKALQKKFGKDEWWEPYYNIVKDLEPLRKKIGAEGPKDLSKRIETLVKIIDLWRNKIQKDSERNVVVWMVTHKEMMRCFLQYGLNFGDKVKGWTPATNETVEISFSPENKIFVEFRGKRHEIQEI